MSATEFENKCLNSQIVELKVQLENLNNSEEQKLTHQNQLNEFELKENENDALNDNNKNSQFLKNFKLNKNDYNIEQPKKSFTWKINSNINIKKRIPHSEEKNGLTKNNTFFEQTMMNDDEIIEKKKNLRSFSCKKV